MHCGPCLGLIHMVCHGIRALLGVIILIHYAGIVNLRYTGVVDLCYAGIIVNTHYAHIVIFIHYANVMSSSSLWAFLHLGCIHESLRGVVVVAMWVVGAVWVKRVLVVMGRGNPRVNSG